MDPLGSFRHAGRSTPLAARPGHYATDQFTNPYVMPGHRDALGREIWEQTDGRVTAFIEDMESTAADHSGAEGVGVDDRGNVYGAVVRRQMLERQVKK